MHVDFLVDQHVRITRGVGGGANQNSSVVGIYLYIVDIWWINIIIIITRVITWVNMLELPGGKRGYKPETFSW